MNDLLKNGWMSSISLLSAFCHITLKIDAYLLVIFRDICKKIFFFKNFTTPTCTPNYNVFIQLASHKISNIQAKNVPRFQPHVHQILALCASCLICFVVFISYHCCLSLQFYW